MKHIRLLSGEFETKESTQDSELSIDRKVMLVYCGQFESMDGPVEIKDEHIDSLAKNHNDLMTKLAGLAGKDIPLKNCPPIQLDHSVSARDTVGRLVGPLEVGEHNGKKALYGTMRIMGKENVERVKDGRWTNVSIGADLDSAKLTELSITPFPAAPDAAMLSRLGVNEDMQYKGVEFMIEYGLMLRPDVHRARHEARFIIYENHIKGRWHVGHSERDVYNKALAEVKKYIDDMLDKGEKFSTAPDAATLAARLADKKKEYKGYVIYFEDTRGDEWDVKVWKKNDPSDWSDIAKRVSGKDLPQAEQEAKQMIDQWSKLSQGENMYEKLKAFLMGKKKLSAEQADAEMAKMADEEKAKMAADAEKEEMAAKCKKHLMDKEKLSEADADKKLSEMDDEAKKKMAGDYDMEMSRMAEDAKKADEAKMAASKAKAVELSAGIKLKQEKIKLAQRRATITARLSKYRSLAKVTPAEIKEFNVEDLSKKSDEALNLLFESMEKRQPVILAGAFGSMSEVDVAKISAERKKVELKKQVLGAMSFTSSVLKNTKKLSEGEQEGSPDTVNIHVDTDPHTDMEGEIAEIERMMDTDVAKAKEMLREKMKKYMNRPAASMANEYAEPAEKELKELASEVEKMHTDLEQLTTLIGEMAK